MDLLKEMLINLSSWSFWLSVLAGVVTTALSGYLTSNKQLVRTVDKLQGIILKNISRKNNESVELYQKYSSVYGVMFAKRMKEANFVSIVFAVFIILYFFIIAIAKVELEPLIVTVAFIFLFLPWVKLAASAYRVTNGYLGSSEYEVRQFIEYIISEASDDDLNDGGTPRKLVDVEDFSIEKIRILEGVSAFRVEG
ncbi:MULTISPECIES: hypothetical protein [Vibrio]|uniref:ABC transmembrane type-1 domain-containing protein n=1 Tax=Vibrio paracholerae TaxID=650003 RepID=A0ABX9FED1_9VIBR|nr:MULTISPECIES: hypothetical protein [Vibrio]MBY3674261.1 hypothetical protein [Vibrio cholerae]PAS02924.1 hypothetical protein CGT78_19275 [Vibrio cholerae]PAS16315.1 hypothetical protein CGT74_18440 [Vibrio cholerae]RBM52067.1 hypothetical protein DLR69_15360 [Vibrio paracholerae]